MVSEKRVSDWNLIFTVTIPLNDIYLCPNCRDLHFSLPEISLSFLKVVLEFTRRVLRVLPVLIQGFPGSLQGSVSSYIFL